MMTPIMLRRNKIIGRGPGGTARVYRARFATRLSTTDGSASVVVSPRLLVSPSAIFRRIRRMILPERVLGRPGENWIVSGVAIGPIRSEEHTSELQSLMRISYAVFCLKKKKKHNNQKNREKIRLQEKTSIEKSQ